MIPKLPRSFVATVFLLAAGCAPPYMVIIPLQESLPAATTLVIGEIEDQIPATVPPERHPRREVAEKLRASLVASLTETMSSPWGAGARDAPMFAQVSLGETAQIDSGPGDSTIAASADRIDAGDGLLVTGKILSYKKGNQTARFFIGFGAGKGELVVQFTLRHTGRHEDLFVANFRSEVTGAGSDDDPLHGVSRQFAAVLRKNRQPPP